MRRLLTLCIIVGLVLASAAPAGAAPVQKDTFEVIECVIPGDMTEAKVWFTGKNDKIMHFRELINSATEWRLVGASWVEFGTNAIEVNYNGAWFEPAPNVFVPTVGTFWGTFDLTLDDEGDFEGTWSAGKGAIDGRGSGVGVGDSAGQLIKVTLLGEQPEWGEGFTEVCPVTHYVEYTVLSK